MIFVPFVIRGNDEAHVRVKIEPATKSDLEQTTKAPLWQTDWESQYLADPRIQKFSMKTMENQLIALGAYQIIGQEAYVYIIYVESAPSSNPTIVQRDKKEYFGIGEVMIAFGIKFSIDNGCRGDVVFEAKTDELARYYEKVFHAKPVMGLAGRPKRYMLGDEDAWALFSKFLAEEDAENE